jgi:hypothetical protein
VQQEKGVSKEKVGLKYLENIISLFKVILWPLVILILVVLFWKPISRILGVLPSKLSETTNLAIGDISLEIRQQANLIGDPELANKLGDLSVDALNVLLLTDAGDHNLVSYTVDYEEFFLPDPTYMGGIIELEQKGLLILTNKSRESGAYDANSGEYEALFNSLDLQLSPNSTFDFRATYNSTRPLNDAEVNQFASLWFKLTDDGIKARTLIIQTLLGLLINK